ncbi:TIM barrel protein [Pseudopedobacter sp.]|uniref:hydroxypyruvate isomerase family protein n=1 Tax=Pseudopedobacter sp. TaxID=1936787 RepID=UPI00333E75A7
MANRREAIKSVIGGAVAVGTTGILSSFDIKKENQLKLKGNINHAVCKWTYQYLGLEQLCIEAKRIGIKAIDLVGPNEWGILKKHGLDSSMCNGAEINLVDGFAGPNFHQKLIDSYTEMIPKVAKAGYKNLICFSGNRRGMDDETGINNCVQGLQKIIALAEKHNVTLVMELLNSKINHKDYFASRTHLGAEIAKRLGSGNFKLLYDIYHMQVDEGDVIHTIRTFNQYIGHYHTAGVPGRNEIDETQELNYPAIMRAIVATGYKGYVAQEFIPKKKNKLESLEEAIAICDV